MPRLYDLDRLDLDATSTLDARLQQQVTGALREISEPDAARAAGLMEKRLLAGSDPSKVIYSFTLYERAAGANLVRVQTDNYDQPFDINEGAKLDLGSTAKLRTLVTYLEIVARLHARLSALPPEALGKVVVARQDAITRWAVDYLRKAKDRSLRAMLEAAMERKYSASPGERFFTGGGLHTFENFEREDNARILTVREGLQRSVNLVFIRLMRDIVRHTAFNMASSSATLLEDDTDPKRREYLARFADREGREFIARFYKKYQGQAPAEAEARLLPGHPPDAAPAGSDLPYARAERQPRRVPRLPAAQPARRQDRRRQRGAPVRRLLHPSDSILPIAAISPACIRSNCGSSATCASTRERRWRRRSTPAPRSGRTSTAGCSRRGTRARRTTASARWSRSRPSSRSTRRGSGSATRSSRWCLPTPPRSAARPTGRPRSPN